MPPSAASKRPTRELTAPLKAPRLCPNSSVSSSVSGSAPQLTDTNGRDARRLFKWTVRATSSLPVPLSPLINTGLSLAATRATIETTSTISGLSPTMCGMPSRRVITSLSAWFSRRRSFFSAALPMTWTSSALRQGLATKS